MTLPISSIESMHLAFEPFRAPFTALLARMEAAYRERAAAYGFQCRGCTDNCCLTRFHHHTGLEFVYLREGLLALPPDEQERIRQAAARVNRSAERLIRQGEPVRLLCPLNEDGRCRLYPYRPMICRLHGIPHEIRRPGREAAFGPGCEAFTRQCGTRRYLPFDRTPFYLDLAGLEKAFKEALGTSGKFKQTVAEMITVGEAPRQM